MKGNNRSLLKITSLAWVLCLLVLGFTASPASASSADAGNSLEFSAPILPMLKSVPGNLSAILAKTGVMDGTGDFRQEVETTETRWKKQYGSWPGLNQLVLSGMGSGNPAEQGMQVEFSVLPTLRLMDGSAVTPGLDFHTMHLVRQNLLNHRTTMAGKNLVNFRLDIRPGNGNLEMSASLANIFDDSIYLNNHDLNSGAALSNPFVAPRTIHLGFRFAIW